MAIKPTTDDLIGWLKLQTAPSSEALAIYTEAFDAALVDIESRIDNTLIIAQGAGDLTNDANYPQGVRTAVIMEAARLAKRSTSPEGSAGFGGAGIVIQVLGTDPDIERLIRRYLKIGFA